MADMRLEEILDMVVDIWKGVCKCVLSCILAFTFPLWSIPYAIYNKIKYGVWF